MSQSQQVFEQDALYYIINLEENTANIISNADLIGDIISNWKESFFYAGIEKFSFPLDVEEICESSFSFCFKL